MEALGYDELVNPNCFKTFVLFGASYKDRLEVVARKEFAWL